ncbi:MAG: tetratricopeptide repeat-containing protein, partial [Steroidobacteraceae bacterium]
RATTADARPTVSSAEDATLRLETLAIDYRFGSRRSDAVRSELKYLEDVCRSGWSSQGVVAAGFGAAYAEIEEWAAAIEWYTRAVAAPDGGAGLRALEQLGNLRARRGGATGDRAEIRAAIAILGNVLAIAPTAERQSLLGSAYKRLADVESDAGSRRAALDKALEHYRAAEAIASRAGADDLFYPAMNRMNLELRLRSRTGRTRGFEPADVSAVRQSLARKHELNPDFWSAVGLIELEIYAALADRRLATVADAALSGLADVKRRIAANKDWDSFRYQMHVTLSEYLELRGISSSERAAAQRLLQELTGEIQPRANTGKRRANSARKRRPK